METVLTWYGQQADDGWTGRHQMEKGRHKMEKGQKNEGYSIYLKGIHDTKGGIQYGHKREPKDR